MPVLLRLPRACHCLRAAPWPDASGTALKVPPSTKHYTSVNRYGRRKFQTAVPSPNACPGCRVGTRGPSETTALNFCDERSEEHTSELQSLMRISYAVFCLKKKKTKSTIHKPNNNQH